MCKSMNLTGKAQPYLFNVIPLSPLLLLMQKKSKILLPLSPFTKSNNRPYSNRSGVNNQNCLEVKAYLQNLLMNLKTILFLLMKTNLKKNQSYRKLIKKLLILISMNNLSKKNQKYINFQSNKTRKINTESSLLR